MTLKQMAENAVKAMKAFPTVEEVAKNLREIFLFCPLKNHQKAKKDEFGKAI